MTTRRKWVLPVATGALLVIPGIGQAQDPPPPPTAPVETELVSFREVFQYPAYLRPNPFRAIGSTDGGPRFEQLSLIGIILDEDPTLSTVTVTTGGYTVADDGTLTPLPGDAYIVKVGYQIGNTTIREIHRDRIVVDVEEFGIMERRTMTFLSRRPGGSQ